MVEPRRSLRKERKAGAGDSVLRADLLDFPEEWDKEGRRRLSEYGEAILDAASGHGLSKVEILGGSIMSKVAESGDRAHAVLLGAIQAQRTSVLWLFPDARWTDVGGESALLTWAHPDGWLPGDICAWGPKAAAVLEEIEAAWAQLSGDP